MNVRDPKFTTRLEEALRLLAKQPTRPLSYLTSRFDLESGALAMWLAEFNSGQKMLRADRIDQVKAELGAARVVRIEKATPVAKDSAPNASTHGTPAQNAAPVIAAGPKLAAPTSDIGQWLQQQRAEITGRVNCFQVRVTPAMASAWLTFNKGNRKASRAKIRRFSAAMKAGNWAVNGETIKWSATGRLIDGQSRLMAVELAQVPVVLELRAGLPDLAQQSMDSGEIRRGTHVLEMIGEANPGILAPALKLCWLWSKGWLGKIPFGSARVMENAEIAPLLAKHNALKASAGWTVSGGAKVDRFLLRSEAAFFHYIFGTIDAELRDTFFEGLLDGIGLTKLSPVYHLRERLPIERTGEDSQERKRLRRALVIKAWNSSVMASPLTGLRHSDDDHFPEINTGKKTPALGKVAG